MIRALEIGCENANNSCLHFQPSAFDIVFGHVSRTKEGAAHSGGGVSFECGEDLGGVAAKKMEGKWFEQLKDALYSSLCPTSAKKN